MAAGVAQDRMGRGHHRRASRGTICVLVIAVVGGLAVDVPPRAVVQEWHAQLQ